MLYIWGMKKMSDKIPKLFVEYQEQLKKSIYQLNLTQKFVYEGIEMSRTTWERKIKLKSFTGSELLKVCEVVNSRNEK